MSDCYVQNCRQRAVEVLVVLDGWCPRGEPCQGHGYCADHAESFAKSRPVERLGPAVVPATTEEA